MKKSGGCLAKTIAVMLEGGSVGGGAAQAQRSEGAVTLITIFSSPIFHKLIIINIRIIIKN